MTQGYQAVPLKKVPEQFPPLLCVVVRSEPDPATGRFVLLRDLPDASVYLGCLADAEGRILDWLEIWVQRVDRAAASFSAGRENLTNALLDERWKSNAQSFLELDPEDCLLTGRESVHPAPVLFDPAQSAFVEPTDAASGRPWGLCQDDEKLRGAGLPAYSVSLARYWHLPEATGEGQFVPVVAGAPENERTVPLSTALGTDDPAAAFNKEGGLLFVRRFHPLDLEGYLNVLGGKPWSGIEQAKHLCPLQGVYRTLADPSLVQQGGAHLFLGAHGRTGRLVETFHLKLQLFRDAVRLVRSLVEKQQLPLLNLSPDSFRVRLAETGGALPFFWTAKLALVRTGQALPLAVENTEARYFIPAKVSARSIFQPEGIGLPSEGVGSVRIRKLFPTENDQTVLEGTLTTQEKVAVGSQDLVRLRLPLAERIDLYAHFYAEEGMAPGEIRFRTVPQKLAEPVVAALRAAEGVPLARVAFEVLPLLSSPCDLYSLGVLAVSIFLVNHETTLPVALDEAVSLARQVAAEHDPAVPLVQRIRAAVEKDPRWLASLGPHRLFAQEIDPEEAQAVLPAHLWWDAVASILRLFPGIGPDSHCRDLGDAPALALESVFDPVLVDFDRLLLLSRSLIVIDWRLNRDIHSVIQTFLDREMSPA